ncbi:MAG: ATP-dependent DNA ligase [Thermoproteota archaeon]|nr:ATP-dependent DNA ligase [Thermoproteota archaeon]
MLYSTLTSVYQKLESTDKRLEMISVLAELFHKTPPNIIRKVVCLTSGKLHPDWTGFPEIGLAEKMIIRAIADASGVPEKKVLEKVKETGGVGPATQKLLEERPKIKKRPVTIQTVLGEKPEVEKKLTITKVYETLEAIASESGAKSQEKKIDKLAGLLKIATPLEARYLVRTVIEQLRLGVSGMTILDGLAEAFTGSKDNRPPLERAYNFTSDIGYVAEKIAREGLEGIKKLKIEVGRPVRMMQAQKLPTAEEILEKMEGHCVSEFKLDGERMQIHKKGEEITIFSRRLENITFMYPDVERVAKKFIKAENAIVEGEAVAVDPDTWELRPFQVLMQRRRKYQIEEMVRRIPVVLFLFDCLYVDGEDLTTEPYPIRRKKLTEIVEESQEFKLTPAKATGNPKDMESFFHQAISEGCEGLVVKSTDAHSIYQAGARSWRWIKLKRSYQAKLAEPLDLVVVGAFMGRGKRAGTYGAVLAAAYDEDKSEFPTVCKVGSGWTDEDLEELPKKMKPHQIEKKHPQVESILKADVWFEPEVVIEVNADEITLSPSHPCGMEKVREDSGMALRFPRFTGKWRPDKGPKDATTVEQIIQMYHSQRKKIADTP